MTRRRQLATFGMKEATQLLDVTSTRCAAERSNAPRGVATLLNGAFGDLDLAEDAVQEAFAVALQVWPVDGLPPNPGVGSRRWRAVVASTASAVRPEGASSPPVPERSAHLMTTLGRRWDQ
jgi:hypothetical protein